ncbi:MAG: SUMF1/EgtB/PvdO family nonheme iron enzyme, partial [bacterium]|nr:SUMF1/EgtB/PvdO family nonheme iron enzyme [bacterium]
AALRIPGLTIEQVMKRTRRAVIEATADQQVPWTASSLVGEFIPRPLPATPPRKPELAERREEKAVGMWFRYVPEGTFEMGSPASEKERDDDETLHQVTLTHGFWIGETEVTQEQWQRLAVNNPSRFKDCGEKCPVENVNWYEALWYANALSKRAGFAPCYELSGCNGKNSGEDLECSTVTFKGLGCSGYRLPTEAEWEYAARAGTRTRFFWGDDPGYSLIGQYAVAHKIIELAGTEVVGSRPPNAWGLHDTSGNAWEWVEDD